MRTIPPKSRRSSKPPPDLDTRVEECEAQLRDARWQIEALRSELGLLTTKLEVVASRIRKVPPPLHGGHSEEVILVDETHVTLESIRPPGTRRPKR